MEFKCAPRADKREIKSLKVLPETTEMLIALAKAYNTTQAKILDGFCASYGPSLLRQAEEDNQR
jgi:hypothetical protein